jgi:hypothetical protein
MIKKRKKRCDRNHIVYKISLGSKAYVGVTAVRKSSPNKSLAWRWRKHVERARNESKGWVLCEAIRKHGAEAFDLEIVQVVRGKRQAHEVERDLIRKLKPKLNTDRR